MSPAEIVAAYEAKHNNGHAKLCAIPPMWDGYLERIIDWYKSAEAADQVDGVDTQIRDGLRAIFDEQSYRP